MELATGTLFRSHQIKGLLFSISQCTFCYTETVAHLHPGRLLLNVSTGGHHCFLSEATIVCTCTILLLGSTRFKTQNHDERDILKQLAASTRHGFQGEDVRDVSSFVIDRPQEEGYIIPCKSFTPLFVLNPPTSYNGGGLRETAAAQVPELHCRSVDESLFPETRE